MSSLESRIPPMESNYAYHYRKIKLQTFFQAWKRASEQSTPEPISKGVAVYATFKWIELTLDNRRRMPLDMYHFPRHNSKESDGGDSEYFLSRLRDYVCRNIQVSVERMPYFVHSVALLDAFQMSRTFAQWKWFHEQIKYMRRRQHRNRLRHFFSRWQIFNLHNEILENARIAVSLSRERKHLKQSFRNWRVQMKAYFRQRVRVVPFHRRHAIHKWEIAAKNRRMQRYSIMQGRQHYLRRRMKVVLSLWLMQLCRLSQAKKVSFSGEMKSWLLSSVKSRFFEQNTVFGRLFWCAVVNRSKLFTKHPLILRMLHDFVFDNYHYSGSGILENKQSSSAFVTRDRQLQALTALRRVIQVVRDSLNSQLGQRFLIHCASNYYRIRTMLSATRKWMLRVVQRVLDYSTHDEGFRNALKRTKSSAQWEERRKSSVPSPTRIDEHNTNRPQVLQKSPELSPMNPTRIFPHRSTNRDHSLSAVYDSPAVARNVYFGDTSKSQIRYYLRLWHERSNRLHFLHKRAVWLQQRNLYRQKVTIFGSWMVLAARFQYLARISNLVLNHRLHRELYCSFFAWRHVYERTQLIHQNEIQLLRIRSQKITDFSDLYRRKVSGKTKGTVLKVWALFVRDRRRGKVLFNLWKRLQYRLYPYRSHPLGRVFHQWKSVFNQDIIVTCIQRCWRGYQCRCLCHRAMYRYLQWYRRRVPSIFSLRRKHLLRAGWLLFRVYHALHRQRIVRVYQRHQVKRLFRRWWQHRRRHHSVVRQVAIAKRRYRLQCQHQVFHYLACSRDRAHFLYRIARGSRRAQARFALAQLRHATTLRRHNREITTRTKKFMHLWLRWRKQAQSFRLQRLANLHTNYYLLRPALRRWNQHAQEQQYLTLRSTKMMRSRKKSLYLHRWHRRTKTSVQLYRAADLHNRSRILQRTFGQLLCRLLGDEFYRSGTMPLQQQLRRRKRRERLSLYHQHFQYYNNASVSGSFQLARVQHRPGGKFPGTFSAKDGFASMDIPGHLHSRLYKGRVSLVSRSLLWRWRHWTLRRRQHRKHFAQRLQIMKRRKQSLFFYYLLQMWRENHPNLIPGQIGWRKKKTTMTQHQSSTVHRSAIAVPSLYRTCNNKQQRLAWKSYIKRAVQRRKQLHFGGGEGDNQANMRRFHSPRAECLCEIYGYFHRWIFYRLRRQRYQHLVKNTHLSYWQHHQKVAWKHWAVHFTKRRRNDDKFLRLAQQFWLKSVQRKALRRLISLRMRRRMHRKSILWYKTVRIPFRSVFLAMQRFKERRRIYHCIDVLRFKKIVKKLRRRMAHFVERLKLLIFHRKHIKPTRVEQPKEKHRLRLQFRKLRMLCLRYPARRKLELLLTRRRRLQQSVAALRYWHRWTQLLQQVARIVRRFTLVPMYKHWLSRTLEVLRGHRVVKIMQAKQRKRILRACVLGWRVRAIYQQRLQLQAQVIERRRCRKWKQAYFVQWIEALDQHILYQSYVSISAKQHISLKKKYLRTWIICAKNHERVTYQNLLFGWQHWKSFVRRRRYYHHQQYQRAKVHDLWLRSMRRHLQSWIQWTLRMRYQRQRRRFPSLENSLYLRQVQQKYQKYFRRWKRVMVLRHRYEKQHRHRASSTSEVPQLHAVIKQRTPRRSSSKLDPSSHQPPRFHWRDDSSVHQPYQKSNSFASLASPPRPMSMSSLTLSHLSSERKHRRCDESKFQPSSVIKDNNTQYIDQVSRVHPASPFPEGTRFGRREMDDATANEQDEDDYDVPYLSPVRPKHVRPGTSSRFTSEDMLSIDSFAAERHSNATQQAIQTQRATQRLEPALLFLHRVSSTARVASIIPPSHQHLRVESAYASDHHMHQSNAFAPLRRYNHLRSHLAMIAGHRHYTIIPDQIRIGTNGIRHVRSPRERYMDETVPNSKTGLLHLYTASRALLHWYRIANKERRSRRRLIAHRLLDIWRRHMLAQRLRREAFVHRLLLFRRRQLAVHVSFRPWRHVVRTNRLGRALAEHRHEHLVRQCCSRWLRHQAQRAAIRMKWRRIPNILRRRLLFPWAMKQWYVATHQRLAVARRWMVRFVWVQRWRILLVARRFAKYHRLIQIWQGWRQFVAYRRGVARSFRRRRHLLHRLVHKHLLIQPRGAMKRAWHRWQQLVVVACVGEMGRYSPCHVRGEHHVLQSLCLSQAGQVMLFHNLRPLPVSLFQSPTPHTVTRKLPRVEKIRAFLWHRCIAPFEIADERARREYLRRQRLYRCILQAHDRRLDGTNTHETAAATTPTPTTSTTTTTATTTTTTSRIQCGGDDRRSLRIRMAEVLTPATSLGRYRRELSRTKVLEEAASLKLRHSADARREVRNDDHEGHRRHDDDWDLHERYQVQTWKNVGSPTMKWLRRQYIGLDEDVIAAAGDVNDD